MFARMRAHQRKAGGPSVGLRVVLTTTAAKLVPLGGVTVVHQAEREVRIQGSYAELHQLKERFESGVGCWDADTRRAARTAVQRLSRVLNAQS